METNETQDLIVYRDAVLEDKNLIYSTFLKGLYYGESWYTIIPKNIFMENYHKVLDMLLSIPTTKVLVACSNTDPDQIYGYSILGKPGVLHWVFVKTKFRGQGIARDLVPKDIHTVTHLTKTGLSLLVKKNLQFNPFDL